MHTTDKVETFMHVTVSVCPRLEDSIKDFCGQEILDAPCAKCGVHGALQKQLHLAVTPEVMIFQIQRGTNDRKKNNTLVGYPLTLTVSSIMYDLVSVVTLEGPHLSTGHCTAIVKCSSNVWHMVDDAVSRRIPESQVVNKQAYLLVYTARYTDANAALRSKQVEAHDTAVADAARRHEEADFLSSLDAVRVRITADAQEEIAVSAASATAQQVLQVGLQALQDVGALEVLARTSRPAVVVAVPGGAAVVAAVLAVPTGAAVLTADGMVPAPAASGRSTARACRPEAVLTVPPARVSTAAAVLVVPGGAVVVAPAAVVPPPQDSPRVPARPTLKVLARTSTPAVVRLGGAAVVPAVLAVKTGAALVPAAVMVPAPAGSGRSSVRASRPASPPGRASTPAAVQVLPGGAVVVSAFFGPQGVQRLHQSSFSFAVGPEFQVTETSAVSVSASLKLSVAVNEVGSESVG
jgi:hypothetical protein